MRICVPGVAVRLSFVLRVWLAGATGACLAGVSGVCLVAPASPLPHAPPPAAPSAAPRPVQGAPEAGGAYTAAQAARGKAVYEQHCTTCHGSALRGGANEFAAPALAGPFFFEAWSGRTVAELLRYSAENMPPDQPLLPDAAYLDVTAYILQVLGYPAGEAELAADSPALGRSIERQP